MKQYEVTKIAVYPLFIESSCNPEFKLALCWIEVPKDDHIVKELYTNYGDYMPRLIARRYNTDTAAVVGFPNEKKGEKWGMVASVPSDQKKHWQFGIDCKSSQNRETLEYDFIDTSGGQAYE